MLPFILTLLEIGADPNPADHTGFAPLIAALSCSRPQPGSPGRPDFAEIIKLLFAFGAQGFPFFAPAYDPSFHITVYAAEAFGKNLRPVFQGQLDRDYFAKWTT